MYDDESEGFKDVPADVAERLVSGIKEVNEVNKKLDDEDVTKTLAWVIQLVSRPDIPSHVAVPLITKLQAMSFQFKMQGKYYMLVGKGEPEAALKKGLYLSMAEETEKLVQALKYTTRTY